MGSYFIVYSFEAHNTFSKTKTTCILLNTQEVTTTGQVSPGEAIEVSEAIKGARYGRYECRVYKVDGNCIPLAKPIQQKASDYNADLTTLSYSALAGGAFALMAMWFGHH